MTLLANLIWIACGGLVTFFEYLLAGLILCITIIGIPFGLQCFKLAFVSLAPFGVQFRDTPTIGISTLFNIIWLVFAGIWIAITHLFFGIILCITIIGIPFGKQHFKLMSVALTPFGKAYSRRY